MYRLFLSVLILSLSSSGCIFLLADALGRSPTVKKITNPDAKKEPLKPDTDQKMISGACEDVFNTTVTILLDRGYFIMVSDHDAGVIEAEKEDPEYSAIRVSLKESTATRTDVRVALADRQGPLQDMKYVSRLFDDVQKEVIRRQAKRFKVQK